MARWISRVVISFFSFEWKCASEGISGLERADFELRINSNQMNRTWKSIKRGIKPRFILPLPFYLIGSLRHALIYQLSQVESGRSKNGWSWKLSILNRPGRWFISTKMDGLLNQGRRSLTMTHGTKWPVIRLQVQLQNRSCWVFSIDNHFLNPQGPFTYGSTLCTIDCQIFPRPL